jgi:predicted ATPase/DNA-binding CsgD family transcriptional regulator
VRVCHRLDGVPLALELAAVRVKLLSAEQIAARLDDALGLLSSGNRIAPLRQQTLRATLDWSHALLTEPERLLFRQLAVFAGGWTLEAAEGICALGEAEERDLLDRLAQLVDKSLVMVEEGPGRPGAPSASSRLDDGGKADGEPPRFRLLEPVRQYAAERLRGAGEEAERIRRRHAAWYQALAERAEPELKGPGQTVWGARLEREHDNLRAALHWTLEDAGAKDVEAAEMGVRIAVALGHFWSVYGRLREGASWLERALAAAQEGARQARARVLDWAGWFAYRLGEHPRALALGEKARALYRELSDVGGEARVLNTLAAVAMDTGAYPQAAAWYEEALALYRDAGDRRGIGVILSNLGELHMEQGDYTLAMGFCQEGVAMLRAAGEEYGTVLQLLAMGELARLRGDYAQATLLDEEGLARARALGSLRAVVAALYMLGRVALAQGDLAQATALLEEALASGKEGGEQRDVGLVLHDLARCAAFQGDMDRAVKLCGEGVALLREVGNKRELAESLTTQARITAAQGDTAQAAALLRASLLLGRELANEHTIALCLEGAAELVMAQGRPARTARLIGAAEALREAAGAPLPPVERAAYERQVAAARAELGNTTFAREWSAGRALSPEQALDGALAEAAPSSTAAPTLPARSDGKGMATLSRREREVAARVAAGCTNREIAAELHLSERTVDTHVSHILAKLDFTSRAQIAAVEAEQQLASQVVPRNHTPSAGA